MSKIIKESINVEDNLQINDDKPRLKSKVFIKNLKTGEIKEFHNKLLIEGSQTLASNLFNIDEVIKFPSYSEELGLENAPDNASLSKEYPCLFCCGDSGCGFTASECYPVSYTSRIPISHLLPFKYIDIDDTLTENEKAMYYGKKEFTDAGKVAYYFKAFDSQPQLRLIYADGTEVDSTMFTHNTTQKAFTMVETRLKITKNDFRDWFIETEGIEKSRINSLSLCKASCDVDSNGIKHHYNIQPITQLNFTNESLIDFSVGIEIIYQIFF